LTLSLFLVFGACGEDDANVLDTPVDVTTTTAVPLDPFDAAVTVVLELPGDDVFALLDSLGDEDYLVLLDRVGVAGDVEFVETLDYEMAEELVAVLDDALYGELVTLFETGLDPTAASPVTTLAASVESPSIPNAAADVRRLDGGPLGRRGGILVEIGPGDLSFLAFARTGNPDAQVFVTGVVSPSGVDVGDAIGLEYGEYSNFGEAAVYVPIKEQVDLEIGDYEVTFEATDDIGASGALVRSGTADGPQSLDVIFWMATNEEYDRQALEQQFRSTGEAVLGVHGIAIGTMTFIDPPADIIDRYAVLQFSEGGTDADLRALCRAMSTSVGDVRALHIAIVDRLDGDEPDAILEGSSSGLPGTAMLPGSDLSCVAGMASPDPDDPGRDLFDRAVVVWHEAGHHLGLYHTSESDGLYFDLVDDTPECRYEERDTNDDGFVDLYECDGVDADNFMFHDGDGSTMSADQAWTVRRHPLLYPAQG
jgi:hypothetical protein